MEVTHSQRPALMSIKAFAGNGGELLRKATQRLNHRTKVEKLSSIYRVSIDQNQPRTVHDLRHRGRYSGLVVIAKIRTELSPEELLKVAKEIEVELSRTATQKALQVKILTFDNFTQMGPELTLPHPEFHLRPDEIVPAAEIWGDFFHPVINSSVLSLTKRFSGEKWGEFFAQGKSLLDF